jgi:hypothetical protein
VLSSCPVELPNRLGWLTSGRFIRLLFAVVGIALLGALLYNAATVDRVAPTFSIHLSTVNSSGLGMTLTSIDVDFSENVQRDGAESAFSITPPIAGSFHWQGDTLIFTPDAKLPLSTTFHVHEASGVQDIAGNAQNSSGDLTFTTVGAPIVTAVAPTEASQNVAVDSPISITFDRFMDTQKVISGLSISPAAPFKTSWNGTTLTITPTKPLQFGTDYTITVGDAAVDTDGSKLRPFTTTFRTVGQGLRVTALIPSPNVAGVSVRTPIAVVFDGSIDPTSVGGSITLTPPVGGTTATEALPDDSAPTATPAIPAASATATATGTATGERVMVFTPDQPLAPHTTYTVSMSSAVRRTDGQAAPAQSWSFTTGEPPTNALNQIAFLSSRSGVPNVWLMNPDGSNQREVTSELVPVSGFDFSGDGTQIAYTAGGIVKRMPVGGGNVSFITSGGNTEYAPMFTPDGTALIIARRNSAGADLGYWRIPLLSGSEVKQLTPDGAPPLGSVAGGTTTRAAGPGDPVWASRAAISADGTTLLVVRGSDNVVELVDLTGVHPPTVLSLVGNSRPIWVASSDAFYVSATNDQGATWSCWEITPAGLQSRVVPAVGDLSGSGTGLVYLLTRPDGSTHLAYTSDPASSTPIVLTADPLWSEYSPSFSPDGAMIVFARVGAQNTQLAAGIWEVQVDGTGLLNLSTDGSYPRWLP